MHSKHCEFKKTIFCEFIYLYFGMEQVLFKMEEVLFKELQSKIDNFRKKTNSEG